MAILFSLDGETLQLLSARSFQDGHLEDDLQRWADANPHFLNEGQPMLSLGKEITTQHGLSIDNLYLDGNGQLVVAELKRGLAPREVMAQVIDYGAYVSGLRWDDIERLCQRRHGAALDAACRSCFGRPLALPAKLVHRLLVVAEDYDDRMMEAARYLITRGAPLALLRFTYFEVGGTRLFEVRCVLGDIPAQLGASDRDKPSSADEGYGNWLFPSIAEKLDEIAKRQGWVVHYRVNKQSLTFMSDAWPTALGDFQLRADTWRKSVSLRLAARKDKTPALAQFLESHRADWAEAFPARFEGTTDESLYFNLCYELPKPAVGDEEALNDVIGRVERMSWALVPLVTEYFEQRGRSAEKFVGSLDDHVVVKVPPGEAHGFEVGKTIGGKPAPKPFDPRADE